MISKFLPVTALLALAALPVAAQVEGAPGIQDAPPGGVSMQPQQLLSPPARTSVTIGKTKIQIDYSSPSMRKRVIFGGLEPYHKVWRAGANEATKLTSTGDLNIGGIKVPKGKVSLFVWLDQVQWQLIVNQKTGMNGLEYDQKADIGRTPMTMSKPPKPIEHYKITLSRVSDKEGKIELAWENTIASVNFTVE
jgi:hypothetical protein